jgi:hypothetical protein
MSPTDTPPTREVVALLYGEVCRSHADIADFARSSSRSSPRLGRRIFLLLENTSSKLDATLAAAGLLGFVVTLGLFF